MPTPHLHVIGAGLAGLAAATAAAASGARVTVYERAPRAGGRCRSFRDPVLGRTIDNGNHLILSGNHATLAYVDRIGAADRLVHVAPAAIPFVDVTTGERWVLRPGAGRLPFWLLDPARRPKAVSATALCAGWLRLLAGRMPDGQGGAAGARAFARFWQPLVTSVMNTPPEHADPGLMRRVLAETVGRGEPWCRPVLTRAGLDDALVAPALAFLEHRGADVRLSAGVDAIAADGGRATALRLGDRAEPLGASDMVIVATPPWTTPQLVPGLVPPDAYSPILNLHFAAGGSHGEVPTFMGLIGTTAEWVFLRAGLVSVTVSAADRWIDRSAEDLATLIWREVAEAVDLPTTPVPPCRVVKERRATPRQTRIAAGRRWPQRTALANVRLAGDWVQTGLPATIEGAVRSGEAAARSVLVER